MPETATTTRPTALVSGASAGIGRELALCFAAGGHDLVLVARRRGKLEELAEELKERHRAGARVLEADLTDPEAPARILAELERASLAVGVLVNNAGIGWCGPFAESDIGKQLEIVQLNVAALTHLTRLLLPGMISRRRGRILNVASTAAFQPGPLMAVYYATKAYVVSFSAALGEELRGSGVTVTALCPGPTWSEFAGTAGNAGTRLFQRGVMEAGRVARAGYRGVMAGKPMVIPGLRNRLLAQLVRVAPRGMVLRSVRRLNSRPT